jgi:Domain of unknown function (DUF4388)
MAIAGRLAAVSLAEIFQILDRGQKTGLLTIQPTPDIEPYYIWLNQGRIVATAHRLDQTGLISMLIQRQWVNDTVAAQLRKLQPHQLSSLDQPLGAFLQHKGVLQAEQLKLLFHAQVLQRICTLFKVNDGDFKFEAAVLPPKAEMTGLSISTAEATLLGLRVLKDWQPFATQLPQPQMALTKPPLATLTLQLDSIERQLWESAQGTLTLQEITTRISRSLDAVQQAAFRLIAVGLVEEVAVTATKPDAIETSSQHQLVEASEQQPMTRSFLKNLLGFLRSKA